MKRQRRRVREIAEKAREGGTGNGKAMPDPDPHSYEDPREMAEVILVLAEDVPQALPIDRAILDEATDEELRTLARVMAVEGAFEHPPEDPEARERAAEGIAAIMTQHPGPWDLSGTSPDEYTEDELREPILKVLTINAEGEDPPNERPNEAPNR